MYTVAQINTYPSGGYAIAAFLSPSDRLFVRNILTEPERCSPCICLDIRCDQFPFHNYSCCRGESLCISQLRTSLIVFQAMGYGRLYRFSSDSNVYTHCQVRAYLLLERNVCRLSNYQSVGTVLYGMFSFRRDCGDADCA